MPSIDTLTDSTRAVPALAFNPDERVTSAIISDLHAKDMALSDIADKAGTTLEALTLWLSRPEIEARLDAMESVFARRCRLQLADNTGAIMTACNSVITNYTQSESHLLYKDSNLRAHAIMARKASNALLASRILLHLAKHFTSAPSPRPPRPERASPSPLPTPQAPHHDPELDPTSIPTNHEPRFTVLPPLKFTPLKLHGTATDAAHPTLPRDPAQPNPTRENGHHTAQSLGVPWVDAALSVAPRETATPHNHTESPSALQAEGLIANSRGVGGVERGSASDTPGKNAAQSPHPEGVHVPTERARAETLAPSTIYKPPSTDCACNSNSDHPCTRNCRRGHRARDPTLNPA